MVFLSYILLFSPMIHILISLYCSCFTCVAFDVNTPLEAMMSSLTFQKPLVKYGVVRFFPNEDLSMGMSG